MYCIYGGLLDHPCLGGEATLGLCAAVKNSYAAEVLIGPIPQKSVQNYNKFLIYTNFLKEKIDFYLLGRCFSLDTSAQKFALLAKLVKKFAYIKKKVYLCSQLVQLWLKFKIKIRSIKHFVRWWI